MGVLLFQGCSLFSRTSNAEILSKSIDYSNQATLILNRNGSNLSADEMQNIVRLKKMALEEARLVDVESLNKQHDDFGNQWRDKYIKGLDMFIQGVENSDGVKLLQGQALLEEWGHWYTDNYNDIR
jgi:hypothetical protein